MFLVSLYLCKRKLNTVCLGWVHTIWGRHRWRWETLIDTVVVCDQFLYCWFRVHTPTDLLTSPYSSSDVFSRQTVAFHTSSHADRVKQMFSRKENISLTCHLSFELSHHNYLCMICWSHQTCPHSCLTRRKLWSVNHRFSSLGLVLGGESEFPNDGETVT